MDKKTFEEMPDLADRLRHFELFLEHEPCTHPRNADIPQEIRDKYKDEPGGFKGCMIISSTSQMCPACRLRLVFYHTIYNAEAYYPEALKEKAAKLGIDETTFRSFLPFAPRTERRLSDDASDSPGPN